MSAVPSLSCLDMPVQSYLSVCEMLDKLQGAAEGLYARQKVFCQCIKCICKLSASILEAVNRCESRA